MFAALLATAATFSAPADLRSDALRTIEQLVRRSTNVGLAISQSVVSPEPAGDRFASELVEVPVGYAAVHELSEANDVRPVLDASRKEVLCVDRSHRPQ